MNIYKKETKSLLNNIDVFGFRSVPIKNSYQHLLDGSKPDFICYSGIPENFTKEKIYKKFEKKLERFLFVGVLIKRKYPLEIMDALQLSSSKRDFKLNYIGDGFLTKRIENKVHQLNLEKKVKLLGKVSRETVWKEMLKADCFIMISKNEAYGLVYLEAMAAGCITIASRNEGFDGVIKHGFNGFLCESGNKVELSSLIDKINQMDEKNIKEISRNAMFTASALTNFKAAEIYLNKLNL